MVQNNQLVYGQSKERLESIFDAGTFVELGAYSRKKDADEFSGVVCGYGAVCGKLVFAFSQDSSRKKGAFDEKQAKKITDLYSLALKNGAPVIGVFDSLGAVVYDGAAALAAYGKVMKCVSEASGIIPQIAVIDGMCAGSMALIASMFDFAVTIKNVSKLYVNPPFVVGDDVKESDFAAKTGTSVYCADSEASAFAYVKQLIDLLPSNNAEGALVCDSADDVNRVVDFDASAYTPDELISKIADSSTSVKLYGDYCDNLNAYLATFGGILACVAASNPEKKGILDAKSARVIAKLIAFCDSFNIPFVNLVDSEGLDVSLEAEYTAYSSELARLASAYATSTSAKVTVVIGKAYGAAFTLLGSKALGADIAYALDSACISVLSPEASVAFVWNDKVSTDVKREDVEAEWKEKVASSTEALELGEIDDVIEASELRKRICAALSMLAFKADKTPARKHYNLPL
ncbi:MAG: hypothetical protein IKB02_06460 [Clostridia bacterium]|nr:hypothetical protein [Clostridia bacterium]